ncbi:MAG: ribosome rescue protein RqcH [Candidatus Caldarchaeales archaeon]
MVIEVELSYIELKRLVEEVKERIVDSRIENVYNMEDGSLILKLWKSGERYELRIVPGRCFYLVKGEYKKPQTPIEQVLRFRRVLNGSSIRELRLIEGERILVFNIKKNIGVEYLLVSELLPRGTIILLDSNRKIVETLEKLKMRDRRVVPGEEYKLPPSRKSISDISDIDKFLDSVDKDRKVVVGLAIDAGFGRKYAEEIVSIAQVEKNRKFSDLSSIELEKIKDAIIRVQEYVKIGKPVVLEYEDGNVEPLPYLLESIKRTGARIREMIEFNEAVRLSYEASLLRQMRRERLEKVQRRLEELNKELENKNKTIQNLIQISGKKKELARLILAHANEIEELKNSDLSQEKILENLTIRVDKSSKKILVDSPMGSMSLRLDKSIASQASEMFEEVKSTESAIKRLQREISDLEDEIKKVSEEGVPEMYGELQSITPKIIEDRRSWYEKYRWFYTSEGFLAVAGKDASSNHALIKKHLEKNDLVFHAEVKGAPILILKDGVRSNEPSRIEAAQFAACYSKAWKEGLQYVSTYYVKPDQISLTPPPGHYIPKGGIIIKGERKYLTVNLALGVGVSDDKLLWGPFQTFSGRVDKIVKIIPGKKNARIIAEEIVDYLFKEIDKNKKIELVEKIVQVIPYGMGEISHYK